MKSSREILSNQPNGAMYRQAEADRSGWYLYGITRAVAPDALRRVVATVQDAAMPGIIAEPLLVFVRGDLAAIVRAVPLAEFEEDALSQRLNDLAWLEAMARAHNAIIAAIHEQQAILPAKFGSVYVRRADLDTALDAAQARFLTELGRLHDCDEWAIHLYANPSAVEQQVRAEQPALRRLQDEISAARPGRAYFLRQKLAGEVSAAVATKLAERSRVVIDRLRPYAREIIQQSPAIVRTGAEGEEPEILRAALLIERPHRDVVLHAFQASVQAEVGVRGECSGPWPPYSFVTQPEAGRHEP